MQDDVFGRKAVVLDAATGSVRAEVDMSAPFVMMTKDPRTQSSPHNAWVGTKYAYVAALANPTILVIDLATHKEVRRVGPFSQSIRPLTVAADESRVFVMAVERRMLPPLFLGLVHLVEAVLGIAGDAVGFTLHGRLHCRISRV